MHASLCEIINEHNWKPSSDHYTVAISANEYPYFWIQDTDEIELELIDSHNPKFLVTHVIPEKGICIVSRIQNSSILIKIFKYLLLKCDYQL